MREYSMSSTSNDTLSEDIVAKTIKILEKYPLCDRCLGRLFAHLGKNLGNNERGRALKLAAIMELHRRVIEGDKEALSKLRSVLINSKIYLPDLYKELGIEQNVAIPKCFICEDRLDEIISRFSEEIAKRVKEFNRQSFLVGAVVPKEILEKELMVSREFQLQSWESIKREIKREIGKRVQQETGAKVDFDSPQVVYIVDLVNNSIREEIRSLYVYGVYKKLGRMISQNIWVRKDGSRKYKLSIEDAVRYSLPFVKASDIALHIAGREDVDVRMLGTGRALVIEYKKPSTHAIDLHELNKVLNQYTPWIKFNIKMTVRREIVSRIKQGSTQAFKVYRAVIFSSRALSPQDMTIIEKQFNNVVIKQRTPTRILTRKSDRIRYRRVYQVKTNYISPHLFEALIMCDGGLYVKELITGDNGRTTPSFSEALGAELKCLMLDVLYVHECI